jgi:hypothetical protein
MLFKNIYFKSKPDFRPPPPTKTVRDIAWMAPIIGCPEKFDLPTECQQHLGNVNGQYPRTIGVDRLRPSSVISATPVQSSASIRGLTAHFSSGRTQFQTAFKQY